MNVIILASVLVLFATPILAEESGRELKVYHFERMPFFGSADGEAVGILIDISRMVFNKAKINYTFISIPVKRLFESLKRTEYACTIGALKTKEREMLYNYSDDFIYQDLPFGIIVKNKNPFQVNPEIKQVLESNLELGLIDGYTYGNWIDKNIIKYKPKIQRINIGDNTERMYKMIIGGRFDYMFAVEEEAKYVIRNKLGLVNNLSFVKVLDAPDGNKRYILCSKGVDGETIWKINNSLKQIKSSVDYKNLIKQND